MVRALNRVISRLLDHMVEVDPEPDVAVDILFDPAIMCEHAGFDTFEEFCSVSPWTTFDGRRIESIPVNVFDRYVDATTEFDSWTAM